MDNLPNELLVLILNFTNPNKLLQYYQTTKILFNLRSIGLFQIVSVEHVFNILQSASISDDSYSMSIYAKFQIRKLIWNGNYYNQRTDINFINSLSNLTHIKFYNEFSSNVDNLPSSLTNITFGRNFNNSVDYLPPNLIYLKFGFYFDKKINNLPSKLKYLILGDGFNQETNKLPPITHLISFHPVQELPVSVTHLIYKSSCNDIINLPPNIIFLKCNNCEIHNFPNTLRCISFNRLTNIPKTITHIIFMGFVMYPIHDDITHIKFGNPGFNNPIDYLPHNLTHLVFPYEFNQLINNLPKTLTHLTLGRRFNQSVDNLPPNLQVLILGFHFDQSVDNLPSNLQVLVFGHNFNKSINYLPKKLIRLSFGYLFDYPIINLPDTIQYLQLCQDFDNVPTNVISLKLMNNGKSKPVLPPLPKLLYLDIHKELKLSFIPPSVRYLTVSISYVNKIPKTVKFIKLKI